MTFVAQQFGTPVSRHSRFIAEGKLTYADPGVSEHDAVMQVFQLALTVGQLRVSPRSAFELLGRRAEMVKLKHKRRVVSSAGTSYDPCSDAHLYMGGWQGREACDACIQPSKSMFSRT